MPVRYLDPNSDAKSEWTEAPVGPAWSALDDGTRQPSTPDTSDNINTPTTGQLSRQDLTTFTLASGEVVTQVKGWFYCETGATGSMVVSFQGPITTISLTVAAGSSAAWRSITYTGSLTQANLDALQLQAQSVTTGATRKVHAMYAEVTTTLTYTDSGAGTINLSGSGTERKSYIDSGSGSVTASGSGSDQRVAADSGGGALAISGSGAERREFADSGSGVISLAGSGSGESVRADEGSGSVSVAGVGSEAAVHSQTSTGTITLNGSGSESFGNEHHDSGSGTISLGGSGMGSTTHTGQGSGQILITGSGLEAGGVEATAGRVTLTFSSPSPLSLATVNVVGLAHESRSAIDIAESTEAALDARPVTDLELST